MEVIQKNLDEAKYNMDKAYTHIQDVFSKVHGGRVVPTLLQDVTVSYYGQATPLHQLAAIHTIDARSLAVQPWEPQSIPHIEKAIAMGPWAAFTKNDGRMVIVTLPPPSEERRKYLVKHVKGEAEKCRVVIRNIRRDYKELLKNSQKEAISEGDIKRAEKKLQDLTDNYTQKVNDLLASKEADIMAM